ncbi:MAG: TIGR00282 family metallophosphoesterase [Clostridia bacterium]|nr:TIGR00282 family metallophosphoesterase [Oscillospiraceae bacterium]MBQ7960793.1 TIGR00282 family metallophosphoesterase [Clostridia bacterium]
MRILAIGDIVASDGREFIYNNLGRIKRKYKIDYCIANGENAAETNGITVDIANNFLCSGVDVITLGNHTFANREYAEVLTDMPRVIRPCNYPSETEGMGYYIDDLGFVRIGVINTIGRVNMDPVDCPFRATEKILKEIEGKADIVIVDFHAETSSEKLAFGNYFDGKVTAVFGTHTHIQTADAYILPGGTGYISDLGMTGVRDSVLGVKKEVIMNMYYTRKRTKFEKAEGEVWFCGAVFDIDDKTKGVTEVERLYFSAEHLAERN